MPDPVPYKVLTILFVIEQWDPHTARRLHEIDGEANDLAGTKGHLHRARRCDNRLCGHKVAGDDLLVRFEECGIAVNRLRALVKITVAKALPLISPAYDRGMTESELRRTFTARFRMLQPNERFEE